jgi:plastocyanin
VRGLKASVVSILAVGLLAGSAVGVAAQDEEAEATAEGAVIEVVGVEYAYEGLPTSVPAGTTLTFANDGVEVHEMVLNRIADGVTETFEELLAMDAAGVDLEAEGFIDTDFGGQQLLAVPGQTADDSVTLDDEGRYVVLCFIPTGMEPAKLEELGVDISTLGPDTDPATMSPEAQAYIEEVSANPPHVAQGMIQEFIVTAAGTEVGPLPAMDAAEDAAEESADDAEEQADAKEDELEDKADAKEDELEDKADEKEEELRDDG